MISAQSVNWHDSELSPVMSTSNSSSSTNGGKDPVVLAAQPTLDSTLEITAQRLQSLQASQLALATQLNALTTSK